MWRTMQAEPSTSVPYMAHDAVKVLIHFAIFLPAVKSGYETFYCDRFVIITSLRKANCLRWEFTC